MSFLYPLFLIGALAVAVPIVLHLMRRRTDTVVSFPAVRLMHRAPIQQHRKRRLRELILLALRVAALLLLAAAFSRPYLTGGSAALTAPVTVVAIDTSLSLSAPGQFEQARSAARAAVRDVPATHAVGLVTFADRATLIVPPTTDRGGIDAALQELVPGAGGTRYRTALARAAEAIGARDGHIIVVTDLQEAGWEASDQGGVPDAIGVEVIAVEPPAGNLAVTEATREGQAIVAAVHNYGPAPAKATVSARILPEEPGDGAAGTDAGSAEATASDVVEVQPQAAAQVRIPIDLPARGGVEVRVDDGTGYQADNAKYLLLDPLDATPVAVVTGEPINQQAGIYVERALEVAGQGRMFAVRVVDGRAFGEWSAEVVADQAAIVVIGTATLERSGREMLGRYLADGGRMLLTLGPTVDLASLGDVIGQPLRVQPEPEEAPAGTTVVAADTRHPIFRPFSTPSGALGDVFVTRYRRLIDLADGDRVLARFTGGAPALIERLVGDGRLLVFASDLDNAWNRFPLNPAFVPFTIETAHYLTEGRGTEQTWILPDVPPGVEPHPGVFTLPAGEDGRSNQQRVAVNVNLRESNPARTTVEGFVERIDRLTTPAGDRVALAVREEEERQRLWQIGLLVMFLALAGEGLIGRKAA